MAFAPPSNYSEIRKDREFMGQPKLKPGDLVYFVSKGRKLRGVVADNLSLKARGEPLLIPVARPRNTKRVKADSLDQHQYHPQKIRWLPRKEVRKLPDAANGTAKSNRSTKTSS
jgi:hypothetical protein